MAYETWSLDQWVDMFSDIYGSRNRGQSDESLWLHVVEKTSRLAENLRKQHIPPRLNKKGKLAGVLVDIPDTFAWLSAFTSRVGSLEEMTWSKYPGACPYCLVEENCVCLGGKPSLSDEEHETKLKALRENKIYQPKTLNAWQEMFGRIYGRANKIQSLDQVGFHLMEEVGEVAKAFRLQSSQELKEELADVFAWLMGLTIKCSDLTGENYHLSDITWSRYPHQCPHCQANPCHEEIYRAK